MEQIEKAVYELMAVYHVSEEAESAQKDANEQLYREAALKKQIDFCRSSSMRCIRRIFLMCVASRQRSKNPK